MPPPQDADGLRLEVRQLRDEIARLRADRATYRDIADRTNSIVLRRDREGRFRKLALLDHLTGLYNTRYRCQALDALIAASAPEGSAFSILFVDLDHFKRVVDSRGHLNGSRAIQEVAATIRGCLAAPAWAVAYAGDEFVVVLPGVPRLGAVEKAREIRARIRETAYLAGTGQPARLTASFGVATYPDDTR